MMRFSGLAAALLSALIAVPDTSFASERILGLSEFELVSCAGVPAQTMDFGSQGKIYVYATGNYTTTVNKAFNTYIGNTRANSCQANVVIQGGRVSQIKYQKSGGLIAREFQCGKLFSGCKSTQKPKKK